MFLRSFIINFTPKIVHFTVFHDISYQFFIPAFEKILKLTRLIIYKLIFLFLKRWRKRVGLDIGDGMGLMSICLKGKKTNGPEHSLIQW